jgi:hypothetical protein
VRATRRIFKGVLEEIFENLRDFQRIDENFADRGIEREIEAVPGRGRPGAIIIDQAGDQCGREVGSR